MSRTAIVYGGRLKPQLMEIKQMASNMGVTVDLINFEEIRFDTFKKGSGVTLRGDYQLGDYRVIYFKNTKNYWEEVNLVIDSVSSDTIIIDPIIRRGRPGDVCKAHQMWLLNKNGFNVPRTIFGSLNYLREWGAKKIGGYPLILKGSKGDRRTQVFKFFSDESWIRGWEMFRYREKYENQKYMVQEYIENDRDYRVMTVGDKVLGVMERAIGENPRLKNVFSKTELPEYVLKKAVEAAQVCGIAIAGVDVVFKKGEEEPYFWEVNRAPNYSRFEEVTGIGVGKEIAGYIKSILNS